MQVCGLRTGRTLDPSKTFNDRYPNWSRWAIDNGQIRWLARLPRSGTLVSMSTLDPEQSQRVVDLAMDLARAGRTGDLLEFLDHGLPIDVLDGEGNTLLMLAAYHAHAGTVAALVDRGADVDKRNARDQSPIAGALFKGADDVVAELLTADADLDAGTPTARQAAEMFGRAHLLA